MGSKGQTSVAPRVLASWRVSWSLCCTPHSRFAGLRRWLVLLPAISLFFLTEIVVLRYSCSSPPWSKSELKPVPVNNTLAPPPEYPQGLDERSIDRLKYPGRKRVLGFVGVQTGFGSRKRRGLLRETWFPATPQDHERWVLASHVGSPEVAYVGVGSHLWLLQGTWFPATSQDHERWVWVSTDTGTRDVALLWLPATPEAHKRRVYESHSLEAATGLVFRFIIGHTRSAVDEELLQAENSTYGDFLRIDVDEAYLNLNHKTLIYFTTLFKLYEAEFYVKADDDIYLRPDRLSSLISRTRKSPRTYLGCLKKGAVFTNPKLKWFEPKSWLLGSEYFLHAYGPIYSLSYDVVNILNAIPKGRLRMFLNEDVTVGAWMLAFDVSHEMSWPLCQNNCTPTAVAVWDMPTCAGLCKPDVQMKVLHDNPACSGRVPA